MKSSWGSEAGTLTCSWSDMGQHLRSDLAWMREVPTAQGSYLPPLPDFASHSPFGGASWFELHRASCVTPPSSNV